MGKEEGRKDESLKGCKVTITHGIASPGKIVLQRQIRQAGGEVAEKFSETTTHVICGTPAIGACHDSKTILRAREKQGQGREVTIWTEAEMWEKCGTILRKPQKDQRKSPWHEEIARAI